MKIHFTTLLFLFTIAPTLLFAQKHQERLDAIDVLHYKFYINVSDTSDRIDAIAEIKIRFKKRVHHFSLDLINKQSNGKGMTVTKVLENHSPVVARHYNGALLFSIDSTDVDEERNYKIVYSGIPADGLIISTNKYNERTFFGDNWPNRGKNWLPLVDHPSDKATVEWVVTAPEEYTTIANGQLKERRTLEDCQIRTTWKMESPIPTKVMVMGVARFFVDRQEAHSGMLITSWVYPQDSINGVLDFQKTPQILDFLTTNIGRYPFNKLANVQSKTRYGGMENASNIFYDEKRINGTENIEDLIAHEIVHQWFGNSASEENWHHIWLSEGFATYFTNLYFEHQYGKEAFLERIESERKKVIHYAKKNLVPVVDTNIVDYNQLLNPNSYEKGGWVLHMLRKELGDSIFWKGIRNYYEKFKYSNAVSEDFQRAMEEVSGKNLTGFFQQWLYQAGHPELTVNWKYNNTKGFVKIEVKQTQEKNIFFFPLEIEITYDDKTSSKKTIIVTEKKESYKIEVNQEVCDIIIDPDSWLLFELTNLKHN